MMRVAVKPELLRWALERAALAQNDLRDQFPDIDAWLAGTAQPELKELEEFANAVDVAFGALFLPEPPTNWPAPGEQHKTEDEFLQVDGEGGVTIPIRILNELGIAAGDRVRLWQEGGCLKIAPLADNVKLE